MVRPVLKLKPKGRPEGAENCPQCEGWLQYDIHTDRTTCVKCGVEKNESAEHLLAVLYPYPAFWIKGQLLNNRRSGETFILTLLAEEYDPQHPERALIFNNSFDCQAFISDWYSRTSHDPRAG